MNRKRYGFTSAFDYAASPTSNFLIQGIFNKFDDQEYRRAVSYGVEDGEIERELKDRYESQIISSISGGGKHILSNSMLLDYTASYSYSREDEPDSVYTTFKQEDVEFAPNVSPDSIDPDNIQANPLNEDVNEYVLDWHQP